MTGKAQRGFTLIEILVVLVILAIIVAAAAISVAQKTTQYHAKTLASQLKTVVPLASQEALLQSTTYGLMLTPQQYQFFQFTDNRWQPLSLPLFHQTDLPSDIKVELQKHGNLVKLPVKLTKPQPQILFSSTGDVTPFVILVVTQKGTIIYRIEGNANGQITANPVQAK